ncbi:MAG: DNA/RNA nuclease SfsA [Alphaproteobacteria bacterium]|nr:DNA/RNA nuclease SfsA [Alphaproteobacteria bacterium]
MTALIPATLIRRYKRFLADVVLPDRRECTVHCPNPGAMTGLAQPGMRVYLAPARNPKAKLPYRWVVSETAKARVGVDTLRANCVMADALAAKTIPGLRDWPEVRAEVAVAENTRLDFCLSRPGDAQRYYLEVKSATLSTVSGVASFPDTVTRRGQKHLETLCSLVQQGHRGGLFFVVQRDDCDIFCLAEAIDPRYAALCRMAMAAGLEVQAWGCAVEPARDVIKLRRPLRWQDA